MSRYLKITVIVVIRIAVNNLYNNRIANRKINDKKINLNTVEIIIEITSQLKGCVVNMTIRYNKS